ncbi:hypothetical protein [Bradyrhizobium yuanmingense]|uniref:hypothetical protein n=1 Tax=Bradyrhizobium yuanmingense TaxID=108015 RepID=UPI0023B9CA8E|nr:hypothetical protein [Bradyrhizobium yuanmingense]MDF0498259.1 hypothetical protein [Bradyrhizobium yuanmingense]
MQSDVDRTTQSRQREQAAGWLLCYWRTKPAQSFDAHMRAEIRDWVGGLSSIDPQWRAAIAGDAAAAVAIALEIRPVTQVCLAVDITMTILLARAFDNAAAALVLCDALRRIPLARSVRTTLLTSWMVFHSKLALRSTPWRRAHLFDQGRGTR